MEEERIGLFLDYENLAIGARDNLGVKFDFKPVADALAERGRVVVRRAYADWSYFDEDRRDLTRHHIELIDIPQKMGSVRKNAADIKMAVDAVELAFERDYITTFVIGTGDSDFSPLVQKLRGRNKRVIGIGVKESTSPLLPPACDEFLFYDRLEGVQPQTAARKKRTTRTTRQRTPAKRTAATPAEPETPEPSEEEKPKPSDGDQMELLITQTLSGLQRRAGDVVLSSQLKRTLLRKDPTFDEAEYGYRSFGELLRTLADRKIIDLKEGQAKGDPVVDFPRATAAEAESFELLRSVVESIEKRSGPPPLSGLKNELRKRKPRFSEKRFGYGGFLQFCKAAQARGTVEMTWDDEADDYLLRAGTPKEG